MQWKQIDLRGAKAIARICGVYEVEDVHRLPPPGRFKIKVLERASDFIALPNVGVRNAEGIPDWIAGLGKTDVEALQDAVVRIMSELEKRPTWHAEDLEWSDPLDF